MNTFFKTPLCYLQPSLTALKINQIKGSYKRDVLELLRTAKLSQTGNQWHLSFNVALFL